MQFSGPFWGKFERHINKTFAEAAKKYLDDYTGKDIRRAAYSVEAVLPYLGKLRLIDVDDETCQQFKVDRRLGRGPHFDRPAMCGTVNKDLGTVIAILNKAAGLWRWIPMAPRIEFVSGPERYSWPLTWEEQDKLFRRLPTGWDVGAALFAVNTGVRKEELFGMKWEHERTFTMPKTDTSEAWDSFCFYLDGDRTKNGESRVVLCNSIARRTVEAQRDNGSDFVFPSKAPGRKGQKVRNAGKIWLRAWKDAGLPMDPLIKKGIHNLRFTYATRLRDAGVVDEDRDALLGHEGASMSSHYGKANLIKLQELCELVVERRDMIVLRAVNSHLPAQERCPSAATELEKAVGV